MTESSDARRQRSQLIRRKLLPFLFLAAVFLATDAELIGHEAATTETKLNRLAVRVVEQGRAVDGMFYALVFTYFVASTVAAGVCGFWAVETGRQVAAWCAFGFFLHVIAVPLAMFLHVRAKR